MGLLCLTDGLGLGHVVQSYCKEATISFTGCRNLVPDPEFYVSCLEESFAELRDAAQALDSAGTAPAPATKPTKSATAKPATPKAKKPAAAKPRKAAKK